MMPRYDPVMEKGKIVEWIKKEGEFVNKGEAIVIIEGEKTTFELEAPSSGKLTKILYEQGSDVNVGEIIALIDEELVEKVERIEKVEFKEIKATPRAKRLAQQYNIDLSLIKGSGPEGRIIEEDVLEYIKKEKLEAPLEEELKPLDSIRKTIAERLSFSHKNYVSAAIFSESDFEELMKLKSSLKEKMNKNISITAFLVKACSIALKDFPMINSSWEEDKIRIHKKINIAVGIDTPRGLFAPVIHECDKRSLEEISKVIEDYANRAREGTLRIEELTNSTFTVSNLGSYDVELFLPVINPPNCAILGLGRISKRPTVIDDKIVLRFKGNLSLIFDHRIIDGAPAASFLGRIKELIENPYMLLV